MDSPKVSIIIVNWNGKQDLVKCLTSLRELDYPNRELIVVDNGSTDGSLEILEQEFPEAEVIPLGKNLGRSEALNIGTRRSTGDLILHLDNDTRICDPLFLSKLVDLILGDEKVGVCGPMVLNMDTNVIQTMGAYVKLRSGGARQAQGVGEEDEGQYRKPFEVDYVVGCAILFRRTVLEQVGLYVSTYMVYYDETDLCICIKKAGYRVVTDPRAKIMHRIAGSGAKMGDFSMYNFIKNRLLLMRRHGSFADWVAFLPKFVTGPVPFYSRRLMIRQPWRVARLTAKAIWWNIVDAVCRPARSANEKLDTLLARAVKPVRIAMPLKSFLHYSTELANGVSLTGNDVLAIYHDKTKSWGLEDGETVSEAIEEVLKPQVQRLILHYPPAMSLRHSVGNLKVIYQLVRSMRCFQPDVIHMQSNRDYRIYLATRFMQRRCPLIYTLHDASPHLGESWGRILPVVNSMYLKRATRIICLSEYTKQSLVEQGFAEERIDVIPHPAHLLFRTWLKSEHKEEDKTVLFFGRMHKYKGLSILVDAIPLVRQHVPDAKFILAGSGPELEARASEIESLPDVEIICERIPSRAMAGLFSRASVVTLPYTEASQSGVVTIAYAFYKPVVATDVGGLPEAVEHGKTGLIVPPGDPQKLADALVRILSDPGYRHTLSNNVRELANGRLSPRAIGEQLMECYDKAIKQHPRRRKERDR